MGCRHKQNRRNRVQLKKDAAQLFHDLFMKHNFDVVTKGRIEEMIERLER